MQLRGLKRSRVAVARSLLRSHLRRAISASERSLGTHDFRLPLAKIGGDTDTRFFSNVFANVEPLRTLLQNLISFRFPLLSAHLTPTQHLKHSSKLSRFWREGKSNPKEKRVITNIEKVISTRFYCPNCQNCQMLKFSNYMLLCCS